jgi:anthranilate phosphoribosyltransferase
MPGRALQFAAGIRMTLPLITRVESGHILTRSEAEEIMEELLCGRIETPDIVRFLLAMNRRAVEVDELAGFASIMRRHAAVVFANGQRPRGLVDTCGTGGDGFDSFNISTAAGIVAAAAGARVAKHGNRRASSRSGSADVLEALGVRIDIPFAQVGQGISKLGFGFLFAQAAHTATRHATPARKQIAVRTVFNLLGPLTNPAGAECQVVGVFSAEVVDLVAAALAELGVQRAFVVHGAGGLDEISVSGETLVAEVHQGTIRRFTATPEDFGVSRAPLEAIRGGTPGENSEIIRRVLSGELGPRTDVVIINAAAALMAAGRAGSFLEAAQLAKGAIASGSALGKLSALCVFTNDAPGQ